jgi:chromosome segregation ATPase
MAHPDSADVDGIPSDTSFGADHDEAEYNIPHAEPRQTFDSSDPEYMSWLHQRIQQLEAQNQRIPQLEAKLIEYTQIVEESLEQQEAMMAEQQERDQARTAQVQLAMASDHDAKMRSAVALMTEELDSKNEQLGDALSLLHECARELDETRSTLDSTSASLESANVRLSELDAKHNTLSAHAAVLAEENEHLRSLASSTCFSWDLYCRFCIAMV